MDYLLDHFKMSESVMIHFTPPDDFFDYESFLDMFIVTSKAR
jgi:hypothetical protein